MNKLWALLIATVTLVLFTFVVDAHAIETTPLPFYSATSSTPSTMNARYSALISSGFVVRSRIITT